MAESLDLARAAVADGITHAAMTPHIHPGRYDNTRSTVVSATAKFRIALAESGIPLIVFPAGEVRLSPDVIDLFECGELPYLGSLNGYQVLLLEFPYGQIPVGTEKLVKWLLSRKVRPLIAHPERNKVVMDNVERISPYVEMGCLLQITAASLIGGFGKAVQDCATSLLIRNLVAVVATDAHNLLHRQPVLTQAKNYLIQHYGEVYAERLTKTTASKILGLSSPVTAG